MFFRFELEKYTIRYYAKKVENGENANFARVIKSRGKILRIIIFLFLFLLFFIFLFNSRAMLDCQQNKLLSLRN